MQRVVLACAVLSFALLASPATAQQSGDSAPASSPAPEPYQLPPPPPFPPMPRTDPHHRWVDTGDHRSSAKSHRATRTHKASTAQRSKTRAHRSKTTAHRSKTTAHHSKARAQRAPARPAAVHLSRKTIRQCHAMSYKQIMGHKNCRALMQQELAAADQRHRTTAHKHKAKTKAKATRKHSAKKRKK